MRWPWQKPEIKEPPKCNHKFKDFPWYMSSAYHLGTDRLEATIIEPYVCLLCKERKDVLLQRYSHYEPSHKKADEWLANEIAEFKDRILPKPVVEDMIADTQLVDREFLKYYEMVHNIESSTPKLEIPKDPNPVSPDQLMQWIMAKNGIEPYASHFRNVRGWEVHTITPLTKEEIKQWNDV